MQSIKPSGVERGSLLEWRWTPFFALLTLALAASLLTVLIVPSTPAQFFASSEMVKGSLGKRSGFPTQTGLGSTLSGEASDDDTTSLDAPATRRGSLQRLSERNRAAGARPAPPARQIAEPVRREIPPPPEPELHDSSNDREEPEEAPVQDEVDEPVEEEEEEAPAPPQGAGGAGPAGEGEAEEGPPNAPMERPKLLNPGVLRTIPGLQR